MVGSRAGRVLRGAPILCDLQAAHTTTLGCTAGTAVATVVVTTSLLLYDWKAGTGHPTVFDHVRPIVRSAVARIRGDKSSGQD